MNTASIRWSEGQRTAREMPPAYPCNLRSREFSAGSREYESFDEPARTSLQRLDLGG